MEELTFSQMATEFVKNHSLMVIAWIAVFAMVVYQFFKSATSKAKVVDNAQLTQLINKEDAKVIDVRTLDEFQRGHIIGSLHILPSEIKTKNLGKLEQHKDLPLIVADVNGVSASGLAEELVKQGFARVYILKEGVTGWRGANLPLVKH
ncbi:rhodanese-related sulfurtransferase [Cricetibacter osteomyelitidis]|uniref:Rhodanese-related sulfurtransferase n=1 Tax=Cricetibacter osteomyelitidis TaxID=1521931 RepID=A0A4R2SZK7_9PAST|nr:rhodanese-like domain-containing protein [Cricetibacter osteomyelitidis]TCP94985.1 rhodanese-related sulfurtransferase [Cricetibacter osteomyelitidis]